MNKKVLQMLALTSLLIMLTMSPPISYAIVWSPDNRLTWDKSGDWMNSIIQTSDGKTWVFWQSDRNQNKDIYYKIYDPSQTHPWSSEIRLTHNASDDKAPYAMQAANGKIWVVWMSNRHGNYDIFYKVHNGLYWSPDTRLTNDTARDELPSVVQAYGKIWVFWDSIRGTDNYDIFYKTTVDNGENWSLDTPLSALSSTADDWDPATTRAKDGKIWLAFTRSNNDNEIYYSFYNGASWSSASPITSGGGNDNLHPSVMQANDSKIWVAWDSGKFEPSVPTDIFYRIYDGQSWSTVTQLTTNEAEDMMPGILQDKDRTIWIAWTSDRGFNFDIYYRTNSTTPEHDVEIFSVKPFKTLIERGESVTIEVVARNHGTNTETIEVKTYVNSTQIGTRTTSLIPGQLYPMNFTWSTTSYAYGDYTISATATPVSGETNTADNTFTDGTVTIAKPPTASFTYSPEYPTPNELITFNATLSTADGGTITNYRWNFGDGNTTNTANPITKHSYTPSGTYNVTLTITDSEGANGTTWKNVPVFTHDVAVLGGSYYDRSPWGDSITCLVDAANQGTTTETFNVTIYFENTPVGTTHAMLSPGETRYNIEILCDTTLVSFGSYSVNAVADTVLGERDTDDNTMNLGYIWLYILDLAIKNTTSPTTIVYAGETIDFNVTVENQGDVDANAELKLYYSNHVIEQLYIFLFSGEKESFTLSWNTTNTSPGNYWPCTEVVPTEWGFTEHDTADNRFTCDMVKVKIPGDVNGDGAVNERDLAELRQAFGSTPGSSNWNREADINRDNLVNAVDLAVVGKNFGKTNP